MTEPGAVPKPELAWLQALRQPQLTLAWSLADWQRVLRLARRLRLLARLAHSVMEHGLMASVPQPAQRHLLAEHRLSRWRSKAMVWTFERVAATLAEAPYPRVLLKGAAYIGQGLPIASGRLPSDLDILVPREHVADAQARLVAAGWVEHELDAHDQAYYHDLSHEVPPMSHPVLALELDLHHNILPPVARTHVDAALLLAQLRPSKWRGWQVFQPMDQVLHSASHLFLDSELRDRVRDLVDLDGLLRHFGADSAFWQGLPARAQQLGLSEPLALAVHFTTKWLQTPVPAQFQAQAEAQGPQALRKACLLALFERVLMPTEPDERPSVSQGLAAQALLIRYHRQRLPLRLLVPHLWHKLRPRPKPVDTVSADPTLG